MSSAPPPTLHAGFPVYEWFDTHAHIQGREFDADRTAVLERARAARVREMVIVGEDEASSRAAIELAATDPHLWAAVGQHPHDAALVTSDFIDRMTVLARRPEVVAVGEIGLDYHYDRSPRPVQRRVFVQQLEMARLLDLPVLIHSRAAEADTRRILRAWATHRQDTHDAPLGVMHCFGYDADAAHEFAALGFLISVPGTVTFKRADTIQSVASAVAEDALVLETDAPVLAPQGHRGRRNEPSYLVETAGRVAALRGVSMERLAQRTTANARRLFRLAAPVTAHLERVHT